MMRWDSAGAAGGSRNGSCRGLRAARIGVPEIYAGLEGMLSLVQLMVSA